MFTFFKKRYDFIQMLLDQTEKTHETIQALYEFISAPDRALGDRVENLEREADELRTKLTGALNASFITPLDREDIFGLSRVIDDIADYAKSTVEETLLWQVGTDEHLKEMVKALEKGTQMICEAVSLLHQKSIASDINEVLMRVKKTENFIEKKYRLALRDLFESTDMIQILKAREIYRHLSNAADRMDEAANILGDILMKTG